MLDVSMNNLQFAYDKELVLSGVDYHAKAGKFICFLGLSGCGKSTLLRLIGGLEKSDPEQLLVGGKPVYGPSLDRAMVFQDYSLFPWMTAGENITIALKQKYNRWSKHKRKEVALEWINNLGLDEDLFDKLPMNISGGQRQRFAVARAFAIDAPLLLMDEPFGSLDAVTTALLQDTILELWQKEKENRKTIFFVTHSVDEALLLATDIVVLGQAPSKIIYVQSFTEETKPKRETLYTDPAVLELRNRLIKIINDEIAEKAQRLKEEKSNALSGKSKGKKPLFFLRKKVN
ncbi:Bicarbonate transport ATP-binding protein CmpD [Sporotomaculum syntrophicum]|uniref:Bicarbonate transport ATP-binding protein CmpD n=1 Tax=Sporotomaculum syntrophicum TaxID=182264 RepID=A0A9D3AZM7_9FIRM|nr:ABC transporter ATP-binding protein [Sporotomaculum syntrophicum]KAF1086696.1 Bicarbonate transport ATP-binding protein CmpD [Sporotomaculum syntrophicum]